MAVRGGKRSAYEPWLGVGIGIIAVGAMSGLALYSWQRPSERRLREFLNAELIISPTGIALWQGNLEGQLHWEELQDVVWKRRSRSSTFARFTVGADGVLGGGVCLLFAGARVCIPDIYDRPLPLIHKLIRHYWKGE